MSADAGRPGVRAVPGLELRSEGPHILIVDDDRAVADVCDRALDNCRVSRAEGGEQALALIAETDFDLVLTDVNMPDMSGLELLAAIKEQDPDQAVVVMTGYSDSATILAALKANADDFISKPFNLLQLQTLIGKVLERARLRKELHRFKRLDRLKTDFLGLISHKLNNPVTALSLFFQTIDRADFDFSDPGFRDYLQMTRAESEGLVQMIRALLTYSELALDDSPLDLSPVDLARLADDAIAATRPLYERSGVDLVTEFPADLPPVPIDRRRIQFAIQALLNNAAEASEPGDRVHVGLARGDDRVTLTVTDPGIGIPAEELPRVGDKFYQVEREGISTPKGFGLGLYYSRLFCRMHGGDLTLNSAVGCGTSASLSLPLQHPA